MSKRIATTDERLLQIAKDEVNELPERRQQDIRILRDRILLHPELKIQTDDAYLLRFLRAACFDHEDAFKLVHNYFEMKADKNNKHLFTDFRPSSIKHVLEAGVTGELSHRDKRGRRVIVIRPGKWDPRKFSIVDIFKANFMTFFKFIEEEETQIRGVVVLLDMKDIGFGQITHLSPFFAKRIAAILQESFPMRMKALHFINEPAVFDYVFAIFKQFFNKKTIDKIKMHGHNLGELAEYFDVELLPEDFGGNGEKYSNEKWMNTLLACDAEFDVEAQNQLVKILPENLSDKQEKDK